jgi:hypothetical protein
MGKKLNRNSALQSILYPDLGAFVRAQILAQQDKPNPIGFTLPDGTKGRVWLASKQDGDDRHWHVNFGEVLHRRQQRRPVIPWKPTAKALNRPIIVVGRNDPVSDMDVALGVLKGFRAEKELHILGWGWRIVTCQFRGNKVILRYNGNTATMKRRAFKALIAANKRLRRRHPVLRLVLSNRPSVVVNAEAASPTLRNDIRTLPGAFSRAFGDHLMERPRRPWQAITGAAPSKRGSLTGPSKSHQKAITQTRRYGGRERAIWRRLQIQRDIRSPGQGGSTGASFTKGVTAGKRSPLRQNSRVELGAT